jgi:hypothetical protein
MCVLALLDCATSPPPSATLRRHKNKIASAVPPRFRPLSLQLPRNFPLSLAIMRLLPLLVGLIPLVACDESSAASTTESSTSTSSDESSTTTSSLIYLHGQTGTANPAGDPTVPTGEYVSYSTTMIVSGTDIPTPGPTGNATASSSPAVTKLVGGSSSGTRGNATASSSTATSTSTPIVNTRPCNGWPEFCSRSYSNITMITAHNSPFSRPDNAASNQALGVIAQLDDGVRMCMSHRSITTVSG